MTTDPGAVPHDAIPLPTDNEENDYEAQDKINGNKFKKVCKRCRAFKPARAHHCSICKRCVIKVFPLNLTINLINLSTILP